jgi:exopolysaccharide biosynthesis polyprenyl glycosylphosphotransferase
MTLSPQILWSILAVLSDGFWIGSAFIAGFSIRSLSPHALLPLDIYLGFALICMVSFWTIQMSWRGYTLSRLLSWVEEWILVTMGLWLAFGIVLAGAFFVRSISLSRLVIGYAGILSWAGLTCTRLALRAWLDRQYAQGWGVRQVLWVGSTALLSEVAERLHRSPQLGFQVTAYVTADRESASEINKIVSDKVDHITCLPDYLAKNPSIQEVWIAQPELVTAEFLLSLQHQAVQIRLLPDIFSLLTVSLTLHTLDGIPLLTLQDPPLRYWYNRFLKRLLDIGGSLIGLILLSPFFILISLGIKATSPGPIFYQQERISLDGQVFWIYKFRTMRLDAETSETPGWTTPEDPRRTPLGIHLRRWNLDEIPQLWNVLKGDMSLVGPRPERPYYVQQFSQEIPKYLDRHLVKTGLTGWAQIHGLRGDTSIQRRTQYDLYYVQNWSLILDLRIILSTLWQALSGKIAGY